MHHSASKLLFLWVLSGLLCGCAGTRTGSATGAALSCSGDPSCWRRFDFSRDTFAFANELIWEYGFDAQGHWVAHARQPKPDYALHCFVVARSVDQFFKFARFDPQQPVADDAVYRKLIHRVISRSPRHRSSNSERIVIPGYADLRSFSAAHQKLLKEQCGSALQSYFQRGNWRMIFPFSRREQQKMAEQLLAAVRRDRIAIAHVVNFPSLSINHAVLLFSAKESGERVEFSAYDPNNPAKPLTVRFEKATHTFSLPLTHYYPGGPVDLYQVYHHWNY